MKNTHVFLLVLLVLASCSPYLPEMPTPTTAPTIQATTTPTPKPAPTATQTQINAKVTALEALNVRQNPSEKSAVKGYLYHSDVIYLSGRCQDGWAQIFWRGSVAWVNADYLSDNKCKE